MKTAAVIAEYNPFHNGHAWQLSKIRELASPDYIVVVLSGDYVQRGTPAILDKYSRAEMALRCGADLVLELPLAASCGSAQRFAEGAAAILDGLGAVDELWFGSEAGTEAPFLTLPGILLEEPESYQRALKDALRNGISFPAARLQALEQYLSGSPENHKAAEAASALAAAGGIRSFLSSPNNILGLEYCLALRQRGSSIRPRTLPRIGSSYHQAELSATFSSATAIRRALLHTGADAVRGQMPEEIFPLLERARKSSGLLTEDDFSLPLKYQLLKETPESLTRYLDVSSDLAARICNCLNNFSSFSQFAELLKTRNITRTAVNRALLHILLGLTAKDSEAAAAPAFARMLGLRSGCALPAAVRDAGALPLITKPASLPAGAYDKELFASNLYETVRSQKSRQPFVHEYSRKFLFL